MDIDVSDGHRQSEHEPGARARPRKAPNAFRTISEVADELHIPQHVLRFWETKFSQVKPLKRGGGRRYYRPDDIFLLRRIADLLYTQGYTIKGVQRLLREGGGQLSDDIPPPTADERAAAEAEKANPPAEGPLMIPGLELAPRSSVPGACWPHDNTCQAGPGGRSPACAAAARPTGARSTSRTAELEQASQAETRGTGHDERMPGQAQRAMSFAYTGKSWVAGPSPAMTRGERSGGLLSSEGR